MTIGNSSSNGDRGLSVGGRGCMTLFFGVFLVMGCIATVAMLGEAVREAAVWFWPEVDCTIMTSGVEETGDDSEPYRPSVRFEYLVDGRRHEGTGVARSDLSSSSFDSARRVVDRYPAGSRAVSRVNPSVPEDAVLERRFPFTIFIAFLPLIFVAVGGGGLYFVWKIVPRISRTDRGASISQRAGGASRLGKKIELGMGLLFTAVGGGLSIYLLVIPVLGLAMAATWVEVPATVISSNVRSWSTDDGTSYRADVLYEYSAGDRSWLSNRRHFFPVGSGDSDDARAIVDRYPEGASTTCFVAPDDPGRSVLDRSFRPVYLIGLFPLIFLLAGVGLTIHSRRADRPSVPEPLGRTEEAEVAVADRTLEPEAGPVAKVIGMLLVAAFWNGIVSVFVWQAVKGLQAGNPEWFLMVFLIPFVLVGLALIGGVFYTFLAAFNPRPTITISPGSPRLGTRLRVEWRFAGRAGRIRHLEIALEGFEKASYRRGTDTHTDRESFASFELVSTSVDWEIARGSAEVEIPEDTMHSFASSNNAIVWSLFLHGDIPSWPDVSETFEVEIRPLARERLLP
jgi:hypothetical protein